MFDISFYNICNCIMVRIKMYYIRKGSKQQIGNDSIVFKSILNHENKVLVPPSPYSPITCMTRMMNQPLLLKIISRVFSSNKSRWANLNSAWVFSIQRNLILYYLLFKINFEDLQCMSCIVKILDNLHWLDSSCSLLLQKNPNFVWICFLDKFHFTRNK